MGNVIGIAEHPKGTIANWLQPEACHLGDVGITDWLIDRSSLTSRLKEHCQVFRVEVCYEGYGRLDPSEKTLLGGGGQSCWVREVYLYGDDKPWVFARSVMVAEEAPQLQKIRQLAERPLGELLFSCPSLQIGPRLVAQFDKNSAFIDNPPLDHSVLWGRRTKFEFEALPLVVTEVFLPGSPAYLKE